MNDRRAITILLIVSGLFLFFKAQMPVTDGDTAYYADIAANMLESGNWITLSSRVTPGIVDKPPLSIWPITISLWLFGKSDLVVKAWHILVALGAVYLTYSIARFFFSPRVGLLSGLILVTSLLFSYQARIPQQDMPALLLLMLILYSVIRFRRDGQIGFYYLAWISMGLSVLNRALAGFVFPAAVVGVYVVVLWLMSREFPFRVGANVMFLHTIGGVVLFAAVSAPWYIAEYMHFGRPFLDLFFFEGNARFMNPIGDSIPPAINYFSYFPLLIVGYLPWAPLLWNSLYEAIRSVRKALLNKNLTIAEGEVFLFVWFLVAFFFPFLIRWRVIRYILPCFPPLAILTARFIDPIFDSKESTDVVAKHLRTSAVHALVIALPVLLVVLAANISHFREQAGEFLPILMPFLVVLFAAILGFALMVFAGKAKSAIYVLLISSILSYSVLLVQMDNNIDVVLPWTMLARTANQNASELDEVVLWDQSINPFLEYYVNNPITLAKTESQFLDIWRSGESGVLAFAREDNIASMRDRNPEFAYEILLETTFGITLIRR